MFSVELKDSVEHGPIEYAVSECMDRMIMRWSDMLTDHQIAQKVLQFQSLGTLFATLAGAFTPSLKPRAPGKGMLGVPGTVLSREFVLLLRLARALSQWRKSE